MLTLKFEKHHFFSSTFWLAHDGKDIARLDFDAANWGAAATYKGKTWRFVQAQPARTLRSSDVFLNGQLIGTWGIKNLSLPDTRPLPPESNRFPQPVWLTLNDGRSLLYVADNAANRATLYADSNDVVARMDIKQGVVSIPGSSVVDDEAVFLAFLLRFFRLYNQINGGAMSGNTRVFYMMSKIDPA